MENGEGPLAESRASTKPVPTTAPKLEVVKLAGEVAGPTAGGILPLAEESATAKAASALPELLRVFATLMECRSSRDGAGI
jgi:hypothetical protein